MSKETYILKSQVHFGSLKTSVQKGTKVIIDRETKTVEINGALHDNLADVELGIKAGCIIPFVDGETKIDTTVKISPKAQEKNEKKMEVQKSDIDLMPKEINIADTKKEVREAKRKEKMPVLYEDENTTDSRGLKVVAQKEPIQIEKSEKATGLKADTQEQILKVVNGDNDYQEIKSITKEAKKPFGLSTTKDAEDVASMVNGEQGTVVKHIGKGKADTNAVSSGKKLVAKHASKDASDKAKATAEARKKASEARRAKQQESK